MIHTFPLPKVVKIIFTFVLALFVVLGVIGGCSSDNNGGDVFVDPADADAVLVGAHANTI